MTNIPPPKVVYQPDIEPDFNSAQISPFHSLSCKSIAGNKVFTLICDPLVTKYLPKMGFPELFEKTIGSIHFIPGIYPYGVSLLTPIHFRVPSLIFGQIIFGPLVAKYLAENGVSELFEKAIGSIHFIPGIYRYGVSLLTPIHFRVPSLICGPLVAKCLAGNGVPELFEKTIDSIHFMPGIYPYGVSLLTPIHFRVPSLIFGKIIHV